MNFYTVKDIKSGDIISHKGLPVMTMVKAFEALGNKDMNTIGENFIFLEKPYKFKDTTAFEFYKSNKNLTFGIVASNIIFEIEDQNNFLFAAIHEGKLRIQSNKSDLENILNTKSLISKDPIEAKALYWLDNGRVGASSATICGTLFPNLRTHHKLVDKFDDDEQFEIDWPHDNDDFDRCIKFFEAVPEAKTRINELSSLSKEWQGLVANWNKIEILIKEDKREDAYDLIKESLGQKKRIKP